LWYDSGYGVYRFLKSTHFCTGSVVVPIPILGSVIGLIMGRLLGLVAKGSIFQLCKLVGNCEYINQWLLSLSVPLKQLEHGTKLLPLDDPLKHDSSWQTSLLDEGDQDVTGGYIKICFIEGDQTYYVKIKDSEEAVVTEDEDEATTFWVEQNRQYLSL
jgi:hypothetical protein